MSEHGPVTVREIRKQVAEQIGRDDARVLLSLMLDVTPADLSLRADRVLSRAQVNAIRRATERRLQDAPLAYCTGRAPFRHMVLDVNERVLIPRPETEVLVDEVLKISSMQPGGIAVDLGTGSGAIALSLASEGHFDRVVATDVSLDALEVARQNLRQLPTGCATLELRSGAGFTPLEGLRARVLASNPPYIAYDEAEGLPPGVRNWEPAVALFAAERGMGMYDLIFREAQAYLEAEGRGWLVLEVDARRAEVTAERAVATGYLDDVRLVPDLTGRKRVLVARTTR